jgi:hypothetical protein
MSLAQIGEFAFVLLSRASNLHLVEVTGTITVYLEIFLNRELLAKRILYEPCQLLYYLLMVVVHGNIYWNWPRVMLRESLEITS